MLPSDVPETRYAKTADGVHIGYQVVGDGPVDLVVVPYEYSNIEASWDVPQYASFVRGLAAHARVLLFDRRGVGTSDRSGELALTIEARMDDIRAVMDAAGSERAFLYGMESGTELCLVFAAAHPERTAGVISFGGAAAGRWAEDYPSAWKDEEWDAWLDRVDREWGSPGFVQDLVEWMSPSLAGDAEYVRRMGRVLRLSASPGDAGARDRAHRDTDVRHVLPAVQVPTLLLHRTGDKVEPIGESRYMAEHLQDARLVELPGEDHIFPMDDLVPHIAGFLDSISAEEAAFDRVLATVLFTDIVGSTQKATELGDHDWRGLLDRHHAIVRGLLGRYRGTEMANAGDGFFATFDGPARAVTCAQAITDAVRRIGLEIRAGVHTGEIERVGADVRGLAVHIGARIGALAAPSEVLVSQTVRDLVAGSGLTFADAGEHELKGVPDRWHLYRVAPPAAEPAGPSTV